MGFGVKNEESGNWPRRQPGADNFKLKTGRSLTGGMLVAGAGPAIARPPAPAAVRLTSELWPRGQRMLATGAAGATALIASPPRSPPPPSIGGGGHRPLAGRGDRHDDDAVRARRHLAAAGSVCVIAARSRSSAPRLDARPRAADVRSGRGARRGGSARRHLLRRRRALGAVGCGRDVRRCGVRAVGLAGRRPSSSGRDHCYVQILGRFFPQPVGSDHFPSWTPMWSPSRPRPPARSDSRWRSCSSSGPRGCSFTRR